MNQRKSFIDERDRLALISRKSDPLETLIEASDWDLFRGKPRRCFVKEPGGPGGGPPFDYAMMFRVLVLQRLVNLPLQAGAPVDIASRWIDRRLGWTPEPRARSGNRQRGWRRSMRLEPIGKVIDDGRSR